MEKFSSKIVVFAAIGCGDQYCFWNGSAAVKYTIAIS